MADPGIAYPATTEQVLRALKSASESLSRPATAAPAVRDRADELKFQMAVRHWCDPASLLPDLPDPEKLKVLDRVLSDCGVAWRGEKSEWLLLDDPRRHALRSVTPAAVAAALGQAGEGDPVTAALSHLYIGGRFEIDRTDLASLRMLLAAQGWTEGHAPHPVDRLDLQRRITRAHRFEDFERILKRGFFGRRKEVSQLVEFMAGSAHRGARIEALYLSGEGGMGKSTLLAKAMTDLLERQPDAVFLHFDFDRSDLDPTRTFSLNLELLQQAASFAPSGGVDLVQRRDYIRLDLAEQRGSSSGRRTRSDDHEQVGPVDLAAARSSYSPPRRAGRESYDFESESSDSSSQSAVGGAFSWLSNTDRPLVLILDTFEQVEAGGEYFLEAIGRWISQLPYSSGARAVRVVISGRGDAKAMSSRIANLGQSEEIALGELDEKDSIALLQSDGVSDKSLAQQLRQAFGGNPLVLRLVADVLARSSPKELDDIIAKARSGAMPQELVQGMLYDRILKHVPAIAEPYAHPGLALPEITPAMIRQVLAPAQGKTRMRAAEANEIFEALASASWLVRREPGRKSISQRPDVRRLTLRLIGSDPKRADQVEAVRQRAIDHHMRYRGSRHHAMLLYHQLMGVRDPSELAFLEGRDLSRLMPFLRPHLEDLPEIARNALLSLFSNRLGPEDAIQTLGDEAWARFMGGDDTDRGFGDRSAESADPLIALDLWRRRPFYWKSGAPTFVVQAMAESAQWETWKIHLGPLLLSWDRERDPDPIRRLYWLIRLWLVSSRERLPSEAWSHVQALFKSTRALSSLSQLASLLALADAREREPGFAEWHKRSRIPADWDPRIFLASAIGEPIGHRLSVPIDRIVVVQGDWIEQVLGTCGKAFASSNRGVLEAAQRSIAELHGEPWAHYSKLRRELKQRVQIDLAELTPECAVLLLRGSLPEFYRPARQALREAFDTLSDPRPAIRGLLAELRPRQSIRPIDFEPDDFADRAVHDPVKWWLALVQFADQARVLPDLLQTAASQTQHPTLKAVSEQFRFSDETLCRGYSSSWFQR